MRTPGPPQATTLRLPQASTEPPPPPSPPCCRPYIGTWANADALTISQWTPLVIDAVDTSSTTWTASTATCKNVPAGLQFSFLTSQTGSGDNPQMQVRIPPI